MLAVRANQLLAGGAGLRPTVVTVSARRWRPARTRWSTSSVRSVPGTSRPWPRWASRSPGSIPGRGAGAAPEPQSLDNNDALALISSNALTLGQAALALDELRGLDRGHRSVVAALSLLAVDGSYEAYAEPVHAARPHRGSYRGRARGCGS